ncbi:MAG: hypothetical protein IIC80_06930 [Chloroflexi bacterium]|nr:hypothetical protein [Chloroflexota bacterium]MCH8284878.1 hypothetical protein [Chloroflexota bacterium]
MAERKPMIILEPTVDYPSSKGQLAPRLDSFDGKVLGFLGNNFQGAAKMLEQVEKTLSAKYDLKGTVVRHKTYIGEPASPEIMDELISSCDAVLTSIGA